MRNKEELEEILNSVSHQDLKDFVEKQIKMDKQLRELFLARFSYFNEIKSKEFYRKQINSAIDTSLNGYGFLGWVEMDYIWQVTEPMLDSAETLLENKNYRASINICTTIIEEMERAIELVEEDTYLIDNIVENSFTVLYEIAKEAVAIEIKKELFNYCITSFKNDLFYSWDWHIELLRLAYKLADSKDEVDTIIKCLNSINQEHQKEEVEDFKYKIMSEYGR